MIRQQNEVEEHLNKNSEKLCHISALLNLYSHINYRFAIIFTQKSANGGHCISLSGLSDETWSGNDVKMVKIQI